MTHMSDPEESGNLAWSRGNDVPAVTNMPAEGNDRQQSAGAPADIDQSWLTAWSRAAALLLTCLALAIVIVVVGWVMATDNKSSNAAQPPGTTAASSRASATTTTTVSSTPDQDSRYIAALNEKGIEFANPDVAVHNGKTVCQNLDAGMTVQQITAQFQQDSPDFAAHANDFVAVSVRAYCTQYSKLVAGF
ncbi:hypothetical protein BST16_01315 [Mycobacterium asiaticum DSM 44297]|uniref:DUF732 domain-containing protein n=3 Tax=Mycobacterium asiaticum TaxID=1790 RepID=A0A1A3IFQ8_MYCAS|nr:hypothetical protein A5661_23110 [Mycobacterium asiaticum]OBJ59330.1 hypothetical protein A9W94_01200 [Mycobacterium asiaticum]OBJ89872.1 hypothetical protein A5640_25020 [Mycobacterium asiaticum]ORA18819.1 hypothetical protein BST16_01315 [Mycobacterium asiaticum DSM 44297]